MDDTKNIITIDGPSYVGKSAIARELSALLGYSCVNTGHLYRAVSLLSIESGISHDDQEALLSVAKSIKIEFKYKNNNTRTIVNNLDLTESMHSPEIDSYCSKIAILEELRNILIIIMRDYSKRGDVIFEGRDLGTVVFPKAFWKFFVDASLDIRAKRMKKKLSEIDPKQNLEINGLKEIILELDERDYNRKIAPLRKADDAILYDNSDSPSEYQDAIILQYYINHYCEIKNNLSDIIRRKK